MAAPQTENPPSAWDAIKDLVNSVATIAGVLLGFTVTFAAQIVGRADRITYCTLIIAWGLSVITIALSVTSYASVVSYLKNGTKERAAVFCANAAFFALLGTAIAFAIFGSLAVHMRAKKGTVAVVQDALAVVPVLSGEPTAHWVLKSLVYDTNTETYELVFNASNPAESFKLEVNKVGEVVKAIRM